ncbi:transcriptional regulator, AraC family with amidase-like domain [Actinokineospora alba]|uniref:Transcriptional regulator, AraC family with amidase-like domain n=1 Tax=Actinokineospora alba TaxID=504798 RepID=A0A1H0M451_9PSEU|nr:helix-turn-helix domain-containing protein [Actinokineospora alba]TDP67571.1 AraC family transcriptional activator FtrA [Actinokineospora alba]SDI45274.1 AraC family transcriptional regulator, transcriptional activator FtrA [Actinokineospora alba]SDO74920.1 transcriptional regulator, AraC family with amidase-like domain [Actinokineospora alba]
MRTVSVLAYPGMSMFELGIVTEVFGLPRPELDVDWYRLTVCAEAGEVPVIGGARLRTDGDLDTLAAADTVIIPGVSDVRGACSPALVAALRSAHARGARLVSICSGAFALAEAGLLDGRRATTHWRYAARLAERFPAVTVDPDVLYVDEGDVLTSAGSAAGLDLCVHLIRTDHGAAVANAVARRLVVPPHREGGQAQFIESPVSAPEDDAVTATMAWALANLTAPITIATLARQAHLSPRSYLRRFKESSGTSPIRWLIAQRVQASLPLLEASDQSVAEIATAVGFDSPVTFRHHFARALHTSPSGYRRAFRG